MKEVADVLGISYYKVRYCLQKNSISRRSLSDAIYIKNNFSGDPFVIRKIRSKQKAFLYGLGIGLFWGEGCKKDMKSVRLGNTDPMLIKNFIFFLKEIYSIKETKLKFGLQIFSDMDPEKAKIFWINFLKIKEEQFGKVIITPARSIGTYKEKTKHGVLTVYFNNIKLRKILQDELESIRDAEIAQLAERIHGKDKAPGSNPGLGSRRK